MNVCVALYNFSILFKCQNTPYNKKDPFPDINFIKTCMYLNSKAVSQAGVNSGVSGNECQDVTDVLLTIRMYSYIQV